MRADGLQGDGRPRLVLYTSAEGHSCVRKSAELLGLGGDAVRVLPTDAAFRMDLGALASAVARDRAAGLAPFCVSATAGTVGTGAFDPLDALADFCAAQGLWLHVDGAYGALAAATPEVAERCRGLARADSLALDPHKWLSVPVECGGVLVRDGQLLRDTFSFVPSYLRTEEGKGFGGLPWFSEYGFQQTRGFRALKLWLVLQHLGRAGVQRHLARHLALARTLGRSRRRRAGSRASRAGRAVDRVLPLRAARRSSGYRPRWTSSTSGSWRWSRPRGGRFSPTRRSAGASRCARACCTTERRSRTWTLLVSAVRDAGARLASAR